MLVRKDEFNITCQALDENLNFDKIKDEFSSTVIQLINQNTTAFTDRLCTAETNVQDRLSVVYSIRGNLGIIN